MEQRINAVYARVSDADDKDTSSVPDQLRDGGQFAAEKWPGEAVAQFQEVVTARDIANRPVFCELLSLCAEGKVKRIIVRDQDRLSRSDTIETLQCIAFLARHDVEAWQYRTGQRIRCDDPHSKVITTIMAGFATFEREIAAVRTRDKMSAMRLSGKWTGGNVATGYDLQERDGVKNLSPNKLAESVRTVFCKAAETRSLAEATRTARLLGLWREKQGVQYALRNRIYVGEWRKPDGTWIKNHHPAIVDEDTFSLAQAITGLSWNPRIRKVDRLFWLQGLVRCQHCNRMLVPGHTAKGNGLRIFYYMCNSRDKACTIKRLPATDFENWVWVRLNEMCQDPKIIQGALDEYERACSQENVAELGQLRILDEKQKEARTKKASIDAYLDKVLGEGGMPSTSWNQKLVEVESQIARLRREADEIRERIKSPQKVSADRSLRALREILGDGEADPKRKMRVLQALVKEVVVGERDIDVVMLDPAEANSVMLNGTDLTGKWFVQPSRMAPRPGFEPGTL